MKHIILNQVTGENDLGEDDGAVGETYAPVMILNPDLHIRSFSARKYDKPGTRLVFHSGRGMPVRETPQEVLAALQSLNN